MRSRSSLSYVRVCMSWLTARPMQADCSILNTSADCFATRTVTQHSGLSWQEIKEQVGRYSVSPGQRGHCCDVSSALPPLPRCGLSATLYTRIKDQLLSSRQGRKKKKMVQNFTNVFLATFQHFVKVKLQIWMYPKMILCDWDKLTQSCAAF